MRKSFLSAMLSAAVALGAACSSSSSSNSATQGDDSCANCGGDDDVLAVDSGSDATVDGSSCPVQSFPANAAACPKTYSYTYGGEACSPVDTQCWYPGQGDFGANGCASAAELQCMPLDSGLGPAPDAAILDDAGDASVGYWVAAQ